MPALVRLLRRSSYSTVLMLGSVACSSPPAPLPDISNAVRVSAVCSGSPEQSYFPAGVLHSMTGGMSEAEWTRRPSRILTAMQEPSLSCGSQSDSYRILWANDWPGSSPTMVRASLGKNNRWSVTAVQLKGSLDGAEAQREVRELVDHEAQDVLDAIETFGLWKRRDFEWNERRRDAELWIVEGRRGDSFHPVFLADADSRAVRKLALVFLKGTAIDPQTLGLGGWKDRPPGLGER